MEFVREAGGPAVFLVDGGRLVHAFGTPEELNAHPDFRGVVQEVARGTVDALTAPRNILERILGPITGGFNLQGGNQRVRGNVWLYLGAAAVVLFLLAKRRG